MYTLDLFLEFANENKMAIFLNLILILINYPLEIIVLSSLTSRILASSTDIERRWKSLIVLLMALIGCYVILEFSSSLKDYNDSRIVPKFESFVRNRIIERVFKQNEINCHNVNMGELIQRLMKVPISLSTVYDRANKYLIPFFLTVTIVTAYLFYIHPPLGLISAVSFTIYITVFALVSRNQLEVSKKREADETNLYEDIDDTLSNVFTVFSLNQLGYENDRLNNNTRKFDSTYTKELRDSARTKFVTGMMSIAIFVILISSTLYFYRKDEIDTATTISLMAMVIFLVKHVNDTIRKASEAVIFMGTVTENEDYLKILNSKTLQDGYMVGFFRGGAIEFKGVHFRYENSNIDALKNVSFSLRPMESVAIIGHSGSGKSSILKLIAGFYKPQKGCISIDGIDLNLAKRSYLRSHITYLSQHNRLFNRPIIDNIIYGTKYNRDQAIRIIRKLNISKVLSAKDLHQHAGKHGDNLSGGQKQIVQLLRCYLLDNRIVLLDEPTSAIDPHYKRYVIALIRHIMKTRQVIMVTHDWSIANTFKRVILIENGEIKRGN